MHHRPSHCGLGCCWEACAQSLAPNAMRTASSASSTDAHFLSSLARHRIGRRSSTCRSSALLCTTRLSRVPLASRACRAGDVVMGCRGCSAAPSEREIARPYFSRGHGAVMYTVPGYPVGHAGDVTRRVVLSTSCSGVRYYGAFGSLFEHVARNKEGNTTRRVTKRYEGCTRSMPSPAAPRPRGGAAPGAGPAAAAARRAAAGPFKQCK